MAYLVSGVRCALTYVLLPFVAPLIGLAPGVGPGLGIVVGTVAVAANGASMRRFSASGHRWRKAMMGLHVVVILFLVALVTIDLTELLGYR